MKKAVFAVLVTALMMPALAQLPGLAFGAGLDSQAARPVTTVTMAKSGNDIVLTWTVAPTGSHNCYVYKGIAHPEFRAEVLLATITDDSGTYTDTGALTRTRQGYAINEFYTIYAVPKAYTALAFNSYGPENAHTPRNASIDIAVEVTNGDVIEVRPSSKSGSMEMALSKTSATKFDLDLYNLPVQPETFSVLLNPSESNPKRVTHSAYDGNVFTDSPSEDGTYTATADEIPKPTVSADGDAVTISWDEITYSYEGQVTAIRVIRTYKGVGDAEPNVLADTVDPDATAAEDDISEVTANWYIFYQLQLVYSDGSYSELGASSDWIRK